MEDEDPGSSYIWLPGKVSSNLSPNDFSLKILNSGQRVSHDFQKRKFHVINHSRAQELSFLGGTLDCYHDHGCSHPRIRQGGQTVLADLDPQSTELRTKGIRRCPQPPCPVTPPPTHA